MSGGTKRLSDEDRILWSAVARTTTPLHGHRLPEPPAPIAGDPQAQPRPEASAPQRPLQRDKIATPQPLDRTTRDKLSAGRLAIGGRVDLHGMTQDQAHALLLSFLARAHAAGLRHVLVITGKGSSSGGEGVLRRAVPGWLATAPFRPLVSGHAHAGRRHGGEGALYLRLRRQTPGL